MLNLPAPNPTDNGTILDDLIYIKDGVNDHLADPTAHLGASLDLDPTLAAGLNSTVPSSGVVKAYVGANGGGGAALGETSTTAYRGDRGKTAYDLSRNPARGAICFSWDGDRESLYTTVLPAAVADGHRHTFYVQTNQIDTATYLTSAQIAAIYAAGMEIGSHSVSHPDMTGATVANQVAEWDNSKTALEAIIGAGNCRQWAYPYGFNNSALKRQGYLRYVTQRLVAGSTGQSMLPLGFPVILVAAWNWTEATHADTLNLILWASTQPIVVSIFAHDVGGDLTVGPTLAQFNEAMALVQSLGLPALTMSQAFGGVNACHPNAGFENGLVGWYGSTGYISAVEDAPDLAHGLNGSYSAKLTCDGSTPANDVILATRIPLWASGEAHRLSFAYRVVIRGGTGSIVGTGYGVDQMEDLQGSTSTAALTATTWTAASVNFNLIVSSSTYARYLGCEFRIPKTLDADLYVDHVHLGPQSGSLFG